MSTVATALRIQREPELLGQTVVMIGGNAGIGLETARRARVPLQETTDSGNSGDSNYAL
ncbi:MAG TPA: hypothetical protein VEJ46_06020 [Candidatus Acidoferrum sp.]|nr:hypothetical protein [Candidatus Acidoferrum sp.]HXZ40605.1 hypothetical protein [Terriglobales bacterium]